VTTIRRCAAVWPVLLIALSAPAWSHGHPTPAPADHPPALQDLGTHHHPITTRSPEAQRVFDQGLNLLYAFNHDEAIRAFDAAIHSDPTCAMAYWGRAMALGPHINNPALDPAQERAARQAVDQALQRLGRTTPAERAYIRALTQRYRQQPGPDRRPADEAYARAMRDLWRQYPHDGDAGALYAEALMDLRPWDLWLPDGRPQPGTTEIVATLERVLAFAPRHPGANHFYIHAVEASPDPGRALAAADRLPSLVPGAGHLVHMPAHIYMRVGQYERAAEANRRAIAVDDAYRRRAGKQGFYAMYMAHNHHFLAAAAMMTGNSREAIDNARQVPAMLPASLIDQMPDMMEGYLPIPLSALVRFGRWHEILAEPQPAANRPITTAVWHYAQGLARLRTGQADEAQKALAALDRSVAAVPGTARVGQNSARHVLGIASKLLASEMAAADGRLDQAVGLATEAVADEDRLRYDEPADWVIPARHTLGALLLMADRVPEATQVYEADLRRHPENGWALFGLTQCLVASSAPTDRQLETQRRLEQAWAHADMALTGSRL
jgi:tetratricopeptide (TPR) repeat protein